MMKKHTFFHLMPLFPTIFYRFFRYFVAVSKILCIFASRKERQSSFALTGRQNGSLLTQGVASLALG